MAEVEVRGRRLLLTYCTNVHAGETLAEIEAALENVTVPLKRRLFPDRPFGLGLWLPRAAAEELRGDRECLESFRRFLESRGLFVFTLNAFPYGGFHAARVKERVFIPSWADAARLEYTVGCGEILAALLPEGLAGSVSSVPVGHRDAGFVDTEAAVANLRLAATEYRRIEERTGRRVVLALEPEPTAVLGTIDAAIEFLTERVFVGRADPARRHLGACFDACHEAVMFEDLDASLDRLARSGIALGKVQVTSALEVAGGEGAAERLGRLESFDEGRYLHQVAVRRADGSLTTYSDLAPFLEVAADVLPSARDRARIHFHVPVFATAAGGLATTRDELTRPLKHAVRDRLTDQFEVETYTFGVVPEAQCAAFGGGDLGAMLEQELRWTLGVL